MENKQKPENSEEEYNGILGDYQEQEEPVPEVQEKETDSAPKKSNPLKIAGIAVVSAALIGGLGFLGVRMANQSSEEPSSQAEVSDSSGEDSENALPENSTAAMYSENFEVPPSLMNCFYDDYVNQYSSILTTYYDIDPATTSLKDQKLPEDAGEDMTWFEYIMSQAKSMATQLLIFQEAANADGYTLTEEDQQKIEEEFASVDLSTYSANVTEEDVRTMIELEVLANSYISHVQNSIEISDDELNSYYQENTKLFDTCSLMGFNIYYQTEEETAESEAESETEEETLMPQEQAQELIEGLQQISDPDEFEAEVRNILLNYEGYEEKELENLSSSIRAESFTYSEGFDVAEWAFGGTAKAGETYLVENEGCYSVYLMISEPSRDDTPSVDVRHILFQTSNYIETPEDEDTELSEEEEEAAEQAALQTCHTYAQNLLNEWEKGEASEDSFAELANQYSEDPGSNTSGGLYEGVTPGEMVQPFNDWCFDSSRKPGDTGIVETAYGVHVMYFSGTGDPLWKSTARSDLQAEKMDQWYDGLKSTYVIASNDDIINSIEG